MSSLGSPGHTPDDVAIRFFRSMPMDDFALLDLMYHNRHILFISSWIPRTMAQWYPNLITEGDKS